MIQGQEAIKDEDEAPVEISSDQSILCKTMNVIVSLLSLLILPILILYDRWYKHRDTLDDKGHEDMKKMIDRYTKGRFPSVKLMLFFVMFVQEITLGAMFLTQID